MRAVRRGVAKPMWIGMAVVLAIVYSSQSVRESAAVAGQNAEQVQQAGLPLPAGPDQRGDLGIVDRERDIVDAAQLVPGDVSTRVRLRATMAGASPGAHKGSITHHQPLLGTLGDHRVVRHGQKRWHRVTSGQCPPGRASPLSWPRRAPR